MSTITTLIPAYRADYLAELFLGLKTQTLQDFRVVLSDDSPDGAISDAIRRGRYDALIDRIDLRVVPGPRQGCFKNIHHLLARWGTESPLVHLHMDDDVIYPDFYRMHMLTHGSAVLGASVSQRWLAGADGRPAAPLPLPDLIAQQPQRVLAIDARAVFDTTIPHCRNWFGEFGNMVLAQAAVQRLRAARLGGLSYYGLGDVGVVIDVAQELPIGFLHDHLSVFRTHSGQRTAQQASHGLRCGYLAWVALALGAQKVGAISADQARHAVAQTARTVRHHYGDDPAFAEFFSLVQTHGECGDPLHAAFGAHWHHLLQNDPDSRDLGLEPQAVAA